MVSNLDFDRPYFILLAEDDPDDRKIASDAFSRAIFNAELRMVSNGVEAMNFLKDAVVQPDVFITDIQMPQLSGLELLALIKQDDELSQIPVVVLSTSSEPGDIRKSKELGVSLYISKPLLFQDWVNAMKKIGELLPN